MNVTIIFPFGWPSGEILENLRHSDTDRNPNAFSAVTFKGWGLWRLEIPANGTTVLEVMVDAAQQYELLTPILRPMLGDEKRLPRLIELYLRDLELRFHPLQIDTPVEEGDVIDIRIHTG